MIVNFAERAHNHNWNLDPVTRSLLDTDFYKLLMLQFIWKHFPATNASFEIINRTASVRLANIVPREELIAQLEHVRRVSFRKSELIWLAGNTFYGRKGIFELLAMSSKLREMTFNREPTQVIRKVSHATGMRTLLEDGILKSLRGITTLEEVMSTCHHDTALAS